MKKLLASLFGIAVVGAAAWWLFARGNPAQPASTAAGADAAAGLHEALWYETLPNGLVHCRLCPNSCRLPDGKIGRWMPQANARGSARAKERWLCPESSTRSKPKLTKG